MTGGTCGSSRATSERRVTSPTSAAWIVVRGARFPIRYTPLSRRAPGLTTRGGRRVRLGADGEKERDEHSPGERDRQGARGQATVQGDLLRQADQRRGLGHHNQRGQLYRLRPGRGARTRTNSQRVALICGQGRVSTASLRRASRVR